MAVRPARPDLAYVNATRVPASELVSELRDLLGARLVAYLGGVKETRAVRQWIEETRQIGDASNEARLRVAYQAAKLITERDTPGVAQAWHQPVVTVNPGGMCPDVWTELPLGQVSVTVYVMGVMACGVVVVHSERYVVV